MYNILSYFGLSLQGEVCLWTILGLVRTVFDATLFKVNSNLKMVWQMAMPPLPRAVARALRFMISGVMLVQCFTVYVFLASYIVLLYPAFLEDRPTLVLPWLLLAAIRNLLCELTSLAMGLGVCLLLGPARTPCVRFLVNKVVAITPSFYIWMVIYSYYHSLKLAATFSQFPVTSPDLEDDVGLQLAVRRRRTKSMLDEENLRKDIVRNMYQVKTAEENQRPKVKIVTAESSPPATDDENVEPNDEIAPVRPTTYLGNRAYEETAASEPVPQVPRDVDRILEQFCIMMLRIAVYQNHDDEPGTIFSPSSLALLPRGSTTKLSADIRMPMESETPPHVGSKEERTPAYLRDYPQIFMKKGSESRNKILANQSTTDNSHDSTDQRSTSTKDIQVSSQKLQSLEMIQYDRIVTQLKLSMTPAAGTPQRCDSTVSYDLNDESKHYINKADHNTQTMIEEVEENSEILNQTPTSSEPTSEVQSRDNLQPTTSKQVSIVESSESITSESTNKKPTENTDDKN
ncbi:uncharacterized protein LOC105396433 isoform X1 [Plutella xylostella]|uniref:uncharacterized protein LOC105396433 isoform X1 n=1 Tax=Plutella xylostella TaxID=51655 RepID=UPI002032DB17|nr:uncharacterized protein LOC105396433 isoform X1 [Plutella xylostella]